MDGVSPGYSTPDPPEWEWPNSPDPGERSGTLLKGDT